MDIKKVKEFIHLAKDEGVSELKYESKEIKVSVSFNSSGISTFVPTAPASAAEQNIQAVTHTQSDPSIVSVTSPFVGTFYASPSPDKDVYVSIGAKVSKGSTLCILEAMKIMNEIESEVSGEIVEICVENESLVEFGQPLFKIRV